MFFELFICYFVYFLGCESCFCNRNFSVLGEAIIDAFGVGYGDDVSHLVEVEIGANAI